MEIGHGRTGNGYSYIDLIGDATYTDYGFRIIRGNSGANTTSQILHRGTGDFDINTFDAANLVFKTTAAERMRIASGGNVGIGTTNPSMKLVVDGGGQSQFITTDNHQRLFITSSPGHQSILYLGDTDSNSQGRVAYDNNTDDMYFNTASTEKMRISSAGNVGIGVLSPSERLHVDGRVMISSSTISPTIKFQDVGTTNAYIGLANGSQRFDFSNDASTTMSLVLNTGNVGIGTTAPDFRLDVSKGYTSGLGKVAKFRSGNDSTFVNFDTVHVVQQDVPCLAIIEAPTGTQADEQKLTFTVGDARAIIGSTSTVTNGMSFYTNRDVDTTGFSSSGNLALHLANSGNVGIGTTSPAGKLEVNGGTGVYTSGGTFIVRQSADSDSSGIALTSSNALSHRIWKNAAGDLNIGSSSNSSALVQLINGNVGIGTTSPSQKLHVAGNATVTGVIYTNIIQTLSGTSIDFRHQDASTIMRVDTANARVGIGTTAPAYKLDVDSGDARIGSSTQTTTTLRLTATNTAGSPAIATALLMEGYEGRAMGTFYTDTGVAGEEWFNGMPYSGNFNNFQIGYDASGGQAEYQANSLFNIYHTGQLTLNKYGINAFTGTTAYALGVTSTGAVIELEGGDLPGGPYLPLAGGAMTGATTHGDSIHSYWGNSNDLDIYHDNTFGSIIRDRGAGDLGIESNQAIRFRKSSTTEIMTLMVPDGAVSLYYDNSKKFETTNTGVTITGGWVTDGVSVATANVEHTDNTKSLFGNGNDLQIYHDGSNSYIDDASGTGSLYVNTNAFRLVSANKGENMIRAFEDGQVILSYNNFDKLATTSTGVTVTGAATATTFIGDLNGTINTVTTAVTKANATNDTTVATTAFVQNLIGTIPAGLVFQGTWNAATNTPTLTSGSGTTGHFYIVSTSGSTNLDGVTDWVTGDWAVFIEQGGTDAWEKIDNSSVLDGAGTGQTLPLWSGSGTSNTLTDAPITVSGNDTTFAGDVTATANYTASASKIIYKAQRSGGAVAGDWSYDDATTDMSLGTSTAHSFSLKTEDTRALTIDTSQNATFAGSATIETGINLESGVLVIKNATADSSGLKLFQDSSDASKIYNNYNGTLQLGVNNTTSLTLGSSQNATFAGDVNVTGANLNFLANDAAQIKAKESMLFTIDSDNNQTSRVFQFKEGSGNTLMTIQEAGNVGIGTTSPLTTLHAEGVVTIKGSGTGTDGSLAIQDNYTTTDHLGNIGWNRSSGGPYLSYGLKQDGSADWKSTFGNFSGMRTYMKLDNDEMSLAWAPAQNTAVGTVVTGLLERFKFKLDSGSLQLNAYDGTNKTGTPTYLLGTDAAGNIVKTNTIPGSAAGPYLPLTGGTVDGILIIDTDTGSQPFYITRSGATDQSLKIYVDDQNVVFESIQDETADDYGGFIFNMDAGTTEPYFDVRKDNSTLMRVDGSGNVGIGTRTPKSSLQVTGGVQMANDADAASADKVGTQRYRSDSNNSYVDMCMQTGAATYEWVNIVQNNW